MFASSRKRFSNKLFCKSNGVYLKELIVRLTWVDYLVIIGILRGCYVGYKSGLFPEILRIAGYLVTVLVTFRYHEALAQTLTLKTFLNMTTASAVAFFLLLAGVFVVTKLITLLLLRLLKVGEGGFFYRLAGAVLGACRWVIILSLLFMLIEYLPLAALKTDIRSRSVSGNRVAEIAPTLFNFLSSLSPQLAVPRKD